MTISYNYLLIEGGASNANLTVEGSDGYLYNFCLITGGPVVLKTALGLTSSSSITPANWSSLTGVYSPEVVEDSSGNLWASMEYSGTDAVWAYYTPAPGANGYYNIGGYTGASYHICMGPSNTIWGTSLGANLFTYSPSGSSQSAFNSAGAVFANIASDGTNVYVADNSGTDAALWVFTAPGVGTKLTPAVTGHSTGLAVDASGDIWMTTGTSSPFYVYRLNSSGAVLASATLASATQDSLSITFDASGNAWIPNYEVLEVVAPGGVVTSYSLSETGGAVVNGTGDFSGQYIMKASDGNVYIEGSVVGGTSSYLVEAHQVTQTMQIVMVV